MTAKTTFKTLNRHWPVSRRKVLLAFVGLVVYPLLTTILAVGLLLILHFVVHPSPKNAGQASPKSRSNTKLKEAGTPPASPNMADNQDRNNNKPKNQRSP